jgi:hypothetical protein
MSSTSELKAFPPANDAIDAIKNIDMDLMKQRSRRDIHYIGKAFMLAGEALYGLGNRLSDV